VLRGGYDPIHTRYSLDLRKLVDVMLQRDPAKASLFRLSSGGQWLGAVLG